MRRVIATAALLLATPLAAQVRPYPSGGDPRLQLVDYASGKVVQLSGSPGYQLMVELSPDERIENVAIGDSSSWLVTANKDGNRLFIKPLRADVPTNMTVVTSVRVYAFDLLSTRGAWPDTPYTLQFHYPAQTTTADSEYVDVSAAARRLSRYRISGDRLVRPLSVSDDGHHTYIGWSRTSPIPAIYMPDASGGETLVDGMMGTDDIYVIDGAPGRLTFRIDHRVAKADRVASRKAR